MVSTLVALGFYLCFLQCFCWLHRVVGSYLHWSSALFANVKRREWKDIQGQDHDSQPEKVDVPSPGPGQVTTPDCVVQVFWGLFHEYGESGAWDWQMDWGSINDVETVHSFQSIRFKLLDAARHQLWKATYCCCHLLQHLKGSHNVHSTVRCFLLISSFFDFSHIGILTFFFLFFHGIKKLSLKQQEKLVGITAPLLVKSIKRLKVRRFQTS